MKKAGIFLKAAGILMLIHAVLHTIGHSGWRHSTDPEARQVIQAMTGPRFLFMGRMHSMGDYFDGYGYACSIAMLFFAAVLWTLSLDMRGELKLIKRLSWLSAIALLIWGIDEWICFFPFAAFTTWLSSLCTFVAIGLMNNAFLFFKRA